MTTNVTYHMTEKAEVLFMAAAKPIKNNFTGKDEYVIKIKLLADSPVIKHLSEINDAIVDTKANRLLEKEEHKERHISFKSTYAPVVFDPSGNRLVEGNIPFFDGRIDKAEAQIVYKVIHYLNTKLVRLQGIKILSLELAPREQAKPMEEIIDEIKEFLK